MFISSFLLSLILFCGLSALGFSVSLLLKQKASHFLLWGIVPLVCAVAIIKTGGYSAFTLVAICLLAYFSNRGTFFITLKERLICFQKEFGYSLLYFVIVLMHFSVVFLGSDLEFPIQQFCDYYFWADLSNWLIDTGIESVDGYKIFLIENKNPRPYHYFDLWLNGCFTFITKYSAIHCLFMFTYPLLLSQVLVSFHDMLKGYGMGNISAFVSAILLLVFTGVWFGVDYQNILAPGVDFFDNQSLLHYHNSKLFPIYLGFILTADRLRVRDFGGVIVLCLVLFYVYPSVLFALVVLAFFAVIELKKQSNLDLSFFISLILLTALLYLFIYRNSILFENLPGPEPILSIDSFKQLLRFLVDKVLQIIVFCSPLLIVSFFYRKKCRRTLKTFLLLFASLLLPLVFAVCFNNVYDYWQFFLNPFYPIVNMGIVSIFVFVMWGISKKYGAILIGVAAFLFLGNFVLFDPASNYYFEKDLNNDYEKQVASIPNLGSVIILTTSICNNENYCQYNTGTSVFLNPTLDKVIQLNIANDTVNFKRSDPKIKEAFRYDRTLKNLINEERIGYVVVEEGIAVGELVFLNRFQEVLINDNGEKLMKLKY